MALLVESVKYGSISTTDTKNNVFYVIIFTSESYTLQDNTTIDWKIITAVKLDVKSQYLCSMQLYTNWYWYQNNQQHVITFPKSTIIHPLLEVNEIKDIHDIPKSVRHKAQAKKPYQDILYVLLILTMITY